MEAALPVEQGWLIAGALLLALEAFGVPGLGFLFAGLAAIVVGVLTHLGTISADDFIMQTAAFSGITALFAFILWKPLKKWRTNPDAKEQFSNIVGDMATVGAGGLERGKVGDVSWSGTTMMAQIDDTCTQEHLAEGLVVRITTVQGNQLIVAPQKDSA